MTEPAQLCNTSADRSLPDPDTPVTVSDGSSCFAESASWMLLMNSRLCSVSDRGSDRKPLAPVANCPDMELTRRRKATVVAAFSPYLRARVASCFLATG